MKTNQQIIDQLAVRGWAVQDSLAATIKRYQQASLLPDGSKLSVDGIYGPQTETALFDTYTVDVPLRERVLAVAASQVGIQEQPYASNSGPMVRMYQKSLGIPAGSSWCLCFVYWVYSQACKQIGADNLLPKTAHCMTALSMAKKSTEVKVLSVAEAKADISKILPGSIPIYLIAPKTGAGHTGISHGFSGQIYRTYEGNSNENGSREGTIVADQYKRRLTDSILQGFILHPNL